MTTRYTVCVYASYDGPLLRFTFPFCTFTYSYFPYFCGSQAAHCTILHFATHYHLPTTLRILPFTTDRLPPSPGASTTITPGHYSFLLAILRILPLILPPVKKT